MFTSCSYVYYFCHRPKYQIIKQTNKQYLLGCNFIKSGLQVFFNDCSKPLDSRPNVIEITLTNNKFWCSWDLVQPIPTASVN